MAKAPRKTKSVSKTCEGLINALHFISVAQKPEDDVYYKTHCILHNGMAMGYNGTITAGAKIEETLEVVPNTYKLIAALERTTKDVSITELEGKLSIRSGAFSCFVPCWHEAMPALTPDPPLCDISDVLKIGFDMISGFTIDNDKRKIVECSMLLRENSMFATDTAVILEFWHGLSLPTIVLPKIAVSAILNSDKKLKQLGVSSNSCTFWFEDNSWIKTQLYDEAWPDIDRVLNKPCNPEPLPEGFYNALRTIKPFAAGKDAEKTVHFMNGALQSHRNKDEGACCEAVGVKHGPAFNIKRLERIEHCVDTIDFYSSSTAFFFSKCGKVRGALAGVRV